MSYSANVLAFDDTEHWLLFETDKGPKLVRRNEVNAVDAVMSGMELLVAEGCKPGSVTSTPPTLFQLCSELELRATLAGLQLMTAYGPLLLTPCVTP